MNRRKLGKSGKVEPPWPWPNVPEHPHPKQPPLGDPPDAGFQDAKVNINTTINLPFGPISYDDALEEAEDRLVAYRTATGADISSGDIFTAAAAMYVVSHLTYLVRQLTAPTVQYVQGSGGMVLCLTCKREDCRNRHLNTTACSEYMGDNDVQ